MSFSKGMERLVVSLMKSSEKVGELGSKQGGVIAEMF